MFIINLLQTEDWHSEKFDVSLVENLPLTSVLSRLDHAKDCIKTILPGATPMFLGHEHVSRSLESSSWRWPLLDRISLRTVRT
jgi:hypothetical protein